MFENNLIIGLGGQGGRSIAAFRRECEKNRHDWEGMQKDGVRVQFLYVDSNVDQKEKKSQWEQYGKDVSLQDGDWIGMDVKSPISSLAVRANISPWLGDLEDKMAKGGEKTGSGNLHSITGAGQLRRYGRALFAEHAQTIASKISEKLQWLLSTGTANPPICFHVFCTLGGGTGSGGLIDLLTMINRIAPRYTQGVVTVMVYCYVAGDARADNNSGYFFENEYAALRDLNALACNRYHPYMAGLLNNEGESYFSGAGLYPPVSQVYLSSDFRTNEEIEVQVEHMARGCFNMLATRTSLDATIQKGFSGEDLIQGNEGENPGDVRQSYRFAAMANKSWFIPIAQIKEMLKFRHEKRVYDAWLEGSGNGKYHQTAKDAADAFAKSQVFSNSYQTKLSDVIEAKKKKLTDQCDELIKNGSREAEALYRFAESGKRYYQELCDAPFETAERAAAEEDQHKMVAEIVSRVRELITGNVQWKGGASGEVWGLYYARDYVQELINRIQTQIPSSGLFLDEEERKRVVENLRAREKEWEKLGVFSRAFAKRDEAMIRQHCEDIMYCVSVPLENARRGLLKEFYDELAVSLQSLVNSLESIIQGVAGRRKYADTEAVKLLSSLENDRNVKNVYEVHALDVEMMRKVLEAIDHEDLRSYLVGYNERWKEFFVPIDKGAAPSVEQLAMKLRMNFYDDAEKTHDSACGRNATLRSLLVGSILERLAVKAGPDKSLWHKTLLPDIKEFLSKMPVSAALSRNGTFLTEPQVAMQGVVAIGFPDDARFNDLANWMAEQFRANWPSTHPLRGSGFGVYRHASPEVIRLMYVPHWFPARFASVVGSLYEKYSKSAREKDGVVKRYFANLDDEGAKSAPKDRVELIGQERQNETVLRDIELARRIKVADASGNRYALLQVDEGSGNMVIMDAEHVGEYGKPYTAAERDYPSSDFKRELSGALSIGLSAMSDEEKRAIEAEYKEKQQQARARGVSDASEEGVEIQQELNYVRRKLGI